MIRYPLYLVPLLLTACDRHEAPDQATAPDSGPPIAVRALTVGTQSHVSTEDIVGTVRSKQRSLVEAKFSGRVLQFLVSPGQMVKAGETMATLDAREIQAKVDQAQAVLEQAQREYNRQKQLVTSGATTKQELDAADSRLKISTAALSEAETMIGYAKVTAPFEGVVTRKLADVGDLAMPGKPLAEVEAPTQLRFEADLPESVLERVKLGDEMQVILSAGKTPVQATVSEISPIADAVSRTFRVKLDMTTTDGLRSGQFGRVAVPMAKTNIISIPAAAVTKRGQMEIVFAIKNKKTALRLVKTGKTLGDKVEILSGLAEGEQIIHENAASFRDGQNITLQP